MQENNRSELERLDQEQQADFLNMLKGFVHNQVHFFFGGRMLIFRVILEI